MLRLGRMIVVLLGIAFAISFMSVLLSMGSIMQGVRELSSSASPQASDTAQTFEKWWIVVALIIATAGISNAVLMSVTERIKEIGTLKCLGARNLHIIEIFLFETILLGTLGGLLGGLLGVCATLVLFSIKLGSDLWRVFTWNDGFTLVGLSVLISLAVSLLSAVIPVILAARIEPAEAMRYEV